MIFQLTNQKTQNCNARYPGNISENQDPISLEVWDSCVLSNLHAFSSIYAEHLSSSNVDVYLQSFWITKIKNKIFFLFLAADRKLMETSTITDLGLVSNLSGNGSSTEFPQSTSNPVVPVIWAILIIVGAVGNGLVLYILLRFGERSVTNIYIINLALADLAFLLIVVPITAVSFAMPTWVFGDGMCRFFMYTIYVSTCLQRVIHVDNFLYVYRMFSCNTCSL